MTVRLIAAITLGLTLMGCSSAPAEPDATAKLIASRYADCVPGLKAADIDRISARRYTWSNAQWSLAWSVAPDKNGDPLTVPTEDSLSQFEKLGCV